VLRERAFSQASIERGAQVFARDRAKRDAENRVAKQLAEQIRGRLASYFIAPTPPPAAPLADDKTAHKSAGKR
jgi:LPS-assembly lipoprotein